MHAVDELFENDPFFTGEINKFFSMLSRDIIIREDPNFIIINKPSGVSTHGGEKVTGETLVDFLVHEYPELKNVGDSPHLRPGIVHRLDKDTSGVMVIARTQAAYEELKKAFMERRVEKRYTALVCGVVKKDFWEMKTAIGRSKKRYTKQISLPIAHDNAEKLPGTDNGIIKEAREAITEFEVIERLQNRYTLLSAFPKTGRMHQIRVQLASFGFPIVCDAIYGRKHGCCPKEVGRLFLHAESISFGIFSKAQSFSAPLPDALMSFLKKLGSKYARIA